MELLQSEMNKREIILKSLQAYGKQDENRRRVAGVEYLKFLLPSIPIG